MQECHLPVRVLADSGRMIGVSICAADSQPGSVIGYHEPGSCYGTERFPAAELVLETIFTDDSETEIKYL